MLTLTAQLELWREVGRHEQLAEMLLRIGPVLLRHLDGIRGVRIRRLPAEPGLRPEEYFWENGRSDNNIASYIEEQAPPRAEEFLARGSGVWITGPGSNEHNWLAWLTGGASPPCWITPLRPKIGPAACLAVLFHQDAELEHSDQETELARLCEPLTVALENDWRIEHLRTLQRSVEVENQRLLRRLGRAPGDKGSEIVGEFGGLSTIFERINLVAKRDIAVLLLGETGSGKEVIARALHDRSARREGPFIRVNCGAIPPELIDSELFGHEKGSFTGASGVRRGWFEQAHHGTLFLDEVGELSAGAQVRLLRVLQEGTLTRVGGESVQHVDVRVISATHRDLAMMVREHRFREDLWYRLSSFPILVPPLRDHLEDLGDLVRAFARKAALRFGVPACEPVEEDIALLSRYSWPGNIRELQTVVERAVLLGNGKKLEFEPALGWSESTHPSARIADGSLPARDKLESLDDAQRRAIITALTATNGKIEGKDGAAAILRINPNTLRARMKKLGIRRERFQYSETTEEAATETQWSYVI